MSPSSRCRLSECSQGTECSRRRCHGRRSTYGRRSRNRSRLLDRGSKDVAEREGGLQRLLGRVLDRLRVRPAAEDVDALLPAVRPLAAGTTTFDELELCVKNPNTNTPRMPRTATSDAPTTPTIPLPRVLARKDGRPPEPEEGTADQRCREDRPQSLLPTVRWHGRSECCSQRGKPESCTPRSSIVVCSE